MLECFNFDEFHPQETTYENVEPGDEDANPISSLEVEQDFEDFIST